MIDNHTAAVLRFGAAIGFGLCVALLYFTERSPSRKALGSLCKGAALGFAILYFIGVFAAADSGADRVLPRFP